MNKLFKKYLPYSLLVLILLVHIFILTKTLFFPYPEIFIYPYLTNNGLKPYSQILDQHFPGLLFLPINFDNLGLQDEVTARFWTFAIVVLIHLMLFVVARKIFKSDNKALFVNVLFLVWHPFFEGWVLWIDSFMPLLLIPAFYAIYKSVTDAKTLRWLILGGLLLGVSILFKQTAIPLSIMVLAYLLWVYRDLKKILPFLVGLFTPIALMVVYFLSLGIFEDFWYWTVTFNLTTYAALGTKAPQTIAFMTRILLVYLMGIFVFFSNDKKLISVLVIFLVGSLAGAFDRNDFVHFQPSLPFALLATVIGINALWKKKFIKLVIIIYCLITIWWLNIFYNIKDVASSAYQGHLSERVFFFDSQTKEISLKIQNYTQERQKIFILGAPLHLYQMSKTLPAGNLFVFQFPWFLKIAEERMLEGIKKDQPEIVIYDRTYEIEGETIADFAKSIDEYINQNYQKIDGVGNIEILRKI